MRLLKFFKVMAGLTAVALIYIHMQMQIFDLAYQGKNKEKQIRKLVDDNGNVTYNILKLKSSNNLGFKLLGEHSSLQFADNARIVKLETNQALGEESDRSFSAVPERKPTFLAGLFSLRSQAEARPAE